MSAIWLIARSDLRRRWRELVLLGVLIALVTGASTAAVVAAVRADSSVERFIDFAGMSSANLPATGDGIGELVEALGALPEVDAVTVNATISVMVVDDVDSDPVNGVDLTIDAPDPQAARWTPDVHGVDIDRPMLLEGRLPRPDRADEIMLFEWMADQTRWQVGDILTGLTLASVDEDRLTWEDFPGFNGPVLDLKIVGIGRTLGDVGGRVGDAAQSALASPQLLAETRNEALWWPGGVSARTSTGANEFDLLPALGSVGATVREEGDTFAGTFVGGVTDERGVLVQGAKDSVHTMAVGLWVFAIAVLGAGALVIGQTTVRHLAGASTTQLILSDLGESRSAIAMSSTIPVAAAAVVGTSIGAILAVLASQFVPTGLARRAEVDPGMWVRPDLMVPIGLAIVAAVALFCFVVSARRMFVVAHRRSVSALAGALARAGAPAPVDLGARLALDRGNGPRRVPTRAAFGALAVAVVGVTAALVLADNVDEIRDSPARWGWNWSSSPDYVADDPDSGLARIAAESDVAAAGFFIQNGVSVNDQPMGGFAIESVSGVLDATIREGRLPEGPSEIALGSRTIDRLGVDVGDTVALGDFEGGNARTVTVVGTSVFPYEIAETNDDGAFVLPETLFDVSDQDTALLAVLIRYRDGADPHAVESTLAERHDLSFGPFATPRAPPTVDNVGVTGQMAVALGIFFVTLGTLAVWHAAVVSVRRRRSDIAIVRALGLVCRQIRVMFLTQSLVFGLLAVAIGVPIGLLVARFVWRTVTDDLGVVTTLTVPWWAVASVVPAVLFLSVLLSWWPGRAASRQDPSASLRVE